MLKKNHSYSRRQFKKYTTYFFPCIIFSIVLIVISQIIFKNTFCESVMINIASTLISVPIVFLLYDLYKLNLIKESSDIVKSKVDSDIQEIYTKFLFFINRFIFEIKPLTTDNFKSIDELNDFLELTFDEILEKIKGTYYPGYFIFSDFEDFGEMVKIVLYGENAMDFLDTEEVAVLLRFIRDYNDLKSLFRIIGMNNFERVSNSDKITICKSEMYPNSDDDFYDVKIVDGESSVTFMCERYCIFEEDVLIDYYLISDAFAFNITKSLEKLIQDINDWKKVREIDFFDIDSAFVIHKRLYSGKSFIINQFMSENFYFDGETM
jgi:hypothetical protein